MEALKPDYNLMLYTPLLLGRTFLGNVAGIAYDWRRSIRRQGGYWLGEFRLRDAQSTLMDIFYNQLMAHVEEEYAGKKTWEGMIWAMDDPDVDADGWFLDVTVAGYAATLAFRFVTVSDDARGWVSDWIDELVTADCEFVALKQIQENHLLEIERKAYDRRAWDELMRVVELGDGTGRPWRLYLDNDRTLFYAPDDTTVKYYCRGGIRRRRSLETMWNHVSGKYTESDVVNDLAAASNAFSVARYGRIEERLFRQDLPQATAESLRDTFLLENAYPWPRVVGSRRDMRLFTSIQENVQASPWEVRPGVVRDMGYPSGGAEYDGWLGDIRDFMIEEVEASSEGVQLRTWLFEESDLMQTQLDYASETNEEDWDVSE